MKPCVDCGESKPLDDFTNSPRSRDGHASYCRPCGAARVARHRAGKPVLYKAYKLRQQLRRFNVGIRWYLAQLDAQDYLCACCELPFDSTPNVDHDHRCCPAPGRSCGACVRTLLCSACNRTAGNGADDPDYLELVARYLRRHRP